MIRSNHSMIISGAVLSSCLAAPNTGATYYEASAYGKECRNPESDADKVIAEIAINYIRRNFPKEELSNHPYVICESNVSFIFFYSIIKGRTGYGPMITIDKETLNVTRFTLQQ